jgi:hypothetical protein
MYFMWSVPDCLEDLEHFVDFLKRIHQKSGRLTNLTNGVNVYRLLKLGPLVEKIAGLFARAMPIVCHCRCDKVSQQLLAAALYTRR